VKHEVVTYGSRSFVGSRAGSPQSEARSSSWRTTVETMYANNGVGLAAEQIGREEAVCVIDVRRDDESAEGGAEGCDDCCAPMPLVLVNRRSSRSRRAAADEAVSASQEYSCRLKGRLR